MPRRPVLIIAGGTGGHVFPALAVADYLRQKGFPLLWLGTRQGLEACVVPESGYQLLTINISGVRGKGFFRWLQAPVVVLIALVQSLIILIRRKPSVVLGMGGFVSGPGGVAAWLMQIPLCIHEQNAIAGLTNRLLAPFAKIVMQAFPNTFPENSRIHLTGNPVRSDIINLPAPEKRYQSRKHDCMNVLVLGGSQGARILNEIIPQVLADLPGDVCFNVRHQAGALLINETESIYEKLNVHAKITAFINDMSEAYNWADIVICRAGALTIAEIASAGVASILVPYPHAVDDHQSANARFLTDHGGAMLLPQHECTREKLRELLCDLSRARNRILEIASKARSLARPDATQHVAELCIGVASV